MYKSKKKDRGCANPDRLTADGGVLEIEDDYEVHRDREGHGPREASHLITYVQSQ